MALVGLILGSVALVIAIGLIIYAVAVGGITSNQFWEEFSKQMNNINNNRISD
jgi:N-glycosylase/DNA lyase